MVPHFKRCHHNNAQRLSSAQISVAVAAAAEIIGSNADLLVEILRRLPAKSLLRFRSVSKPWLFLISSPRFCLIHWLQQPQRPPQFHDPKISGLFFTSRYPSELIKYIPLIHSDLKKKNGCNSSTTTTINGGDENKSLVLFPDPNTTTTTSIEDSCNGLLLICCKTKQSRSYHVYNPTTKQFSTIPCPFYSTRGYPPDYFYLVFDPLKSLHYKIVLLQNTLDICFLCRVHIYSSETHTWWESQPNGDHHPFKASFSVKFETGVYCNGSIHWISYSPLPDEPSLYFDVDQEIFCPMPSPSCDCIFPFNFYRFGESRGRLHLIEYCGGTGFNVDIFEMGSDYSKWSLKYRFSLDSMIVDLASKQEIVTRCNTVIVLGLIHGEDDGHVFLVLFVDRTMIISYNIKDNTFKKLDDIASLPDDSSRDRDHWGVHRYIENIFPV